MKKKIILHAAAILWCMVSYSQPNYTDWAASPSANVKEEFQKESAVIITDSRVYEYKFNEKNEMWVHNYKNRLIRLNDDKGVEMYNKTYVYIPADADVEEIKARTILSNGKIVNLPSEKIFDENEEGKKYKKFAFEGVEKGSLIEYFVKFRQPLSTFGWEIFQSPSPVQKASFALIVPEHLSFDVKGYNGFKVEDVVLKDKKRITTATEENIQPFEDAKYAVINPYVANVQFKLSYNLDKNKDVRINTWNELAKNVYNNYHTYSSSEQKALNSFFKKLALDDNATEESKIILIEDYIKTNISIDSELSSDDADLIDQVVKTRVTSTFGFRRMLIALFQKAGINYQIVFPSKRDDFPIDENFENFRVVDESLLYFPSTGKFLDPANPSLRYPMVSPYYAGTKGLYLKGTSIGDFKTALPNFDSIPMEPYEKNYSNLNVDVRFNSTLDSVILDTEQTLLGYSASFYRPAYFFLPKDKQDEFTLEIIKSIAKTDKITDIKVSNAAMTDASKDLPLSIKAVIASPDLIEKAGNKILLKIGDVIGQQVELYQEKKRTLPVHIQYPHALDRVIRFTIPTGYKVRNLEDLNRNVEDQRQSMGFISTYTAKGNEVEIRIHEYYKEIYYPVSEFEGFRKVVNASADFNKIVLVLEKI